MKTVLVVFTLCLVSFASYAQSSGASASEDLVAGVFITSNLEEIKAAHTPEAFAALDRIHVIQKGQPIAVLVILKGYKPRSKEFILEGECEVDGPGGVVLGEFPHCFTSGSPSPTLFVPPDVVYLWGELGVARPSAPEGTNTVVVGISEVSPNPRFLRSAVARFNLVHSSSDSQDAHSTYYRSEAEFDTVLAAYTELLRRAGRIQATYGNGAAATPYRPLTSRGGIGAGFGTRDPVTCPSTREPVSGPISVEQATQYFMCSREGTQSGPLVLVENLTLAVGKGRPANYGDESDIDRHSLVYPIRGSFTVYTCYTPNPSPYPYLNNIGRNCETYDEPQAAGKCYRTSFDDWRCSMVDAEHLLYNSHEKVPPPPLR